MLTQLSLRFRIFLFFCALALGGAGLAAAALGFGWARADPQVGSAAFVTAFVMFAFCNTGLILVIWLLFDEHVAKPINAISTGLRLRADTGLQSDVNAPYLGDLAPAAQRLSDTASASVMDTAEQVARETARLRAQREQLTALLTEIPIATILLNPAQEIVLYDAQAGDVLAQIAPPRLKAPLSDYFDIANFRQAKAQLAEPGDEAKFKLRNKTQDTSFEARLKALGEDGHMIFIDIETQRTPQRPLVFNFDLMNKAETRAIADTPLSDLCFVCFDTETTGLSVKHDAIIQLGAVRVLGGQCVAGEVFDSYVHPERPIPPASSTIHHITDADVADAPPIDTVGQAFHHFARDAVLVAHNAPFDIGLLRKFAPRMGVNWDHPVLDTVLLSAVVFGTTEDHSLDALCDRLSISIPQAQRHTALGDAQATADALLTLLPLLDGMGIKTFGELVDANRKHARLLQDLNTL